MGLAKGYDIIIVGAGIFGVTSALALRERGHHVMLLDAGPIPHPEAASTDISKVIRMEYGADRQYMEMVEAALDGWRLWNELWERPLYHETGVTMLTRTPMAPGGFEYESYHLLQERGHDPVRMDAGAIAARFPAWKRGNYVDGFYHAHGGYAESGRVVAALLRQAIRAGVDVRPEQPVGELLRESGRVRGVRLAEGEQVEGDHVLVAAGSWTPLLLPELQSVMAATGHPVFHLKPDNPELFSTPAFVVFTADVSRTGWYGFPFHPTEQVIKIANHGPGVRLHPERDERVVTASDEQALRAFLRATFPALVNAPIVYTRRCLYTDTLDEHFWIDRHPEVEGLSVATGGSGHGFKFAPVLGALIADAVEGVADAENAWLARFRWRELGASTAGEEAARFHQPASGG